MAGSGGQTFRLARLLQLREQQVTACQDRVARSRAELASRETSLQELEQRQAAAGLTPGGGSTNGAELQLAEVGRRWFRQEYLRLAQEVADCRQELEAARQELEEAEQRRQRIDRLRERFESEKAREEKRLARRRMNRWGQSSSNHSL